MKNIVKGIAGSFFLFLFYLVIMTVTNSFSYALTEFVELAYLMVPLIILFGIQIALFFYMREKAKEKIAKSGMVASTGVSGGAMVACCLHHLAELLPFLGITGGALFFAQQQAEFLLIGVISGIVGLSWMVLIMKEHGLYKKNYLSNKVEILPMRNISYLVTGIGIILVVFTIINMIGGM